MLRFVALICLLITLGGTLVAQRVAPNPDSAANAADAPHHELDRGEDGDNGDSGQGRGRGRGRGRGGDGGDDADGEVAPPAEAGVVQIVDERFTPPTITIVVGQSVTWVNSDDDEHTATGRGFDTGTLLPGTSATIVFDTPGVYDYVCQFHSDMFGQVIVTDEAGNVPVASPQAGATPLATPIAATASVEIRDFAFAPATISVPVGATVTWTNAGVAPHTVTGAFADSGTLASGQTFSHTFTEAGTFDYACVFHPEMTGQVVVEAQP